MYLEIGVERHPSPLAALVVLDQLKHGLDSLFFSYLYGNHPDSVVHGSTTAGLWDIRRQGDLYRARLADIASRQSCEPVITNVEEYNGSVNLTIARRLGSLVQHCNFEISHGQAIVTYGSPNAVSEPYYRESVQPMAELRAQVQERLDQLFPPSQTDAEDLSLLQTAA